MDEHERQQHNDKVTRRLRRMRGQVNAFSRIMDTDVTKEGPRRRVPSWPRDIHGNPVQDYEESQE